MGKLKVGDEVNYSEAGLVCRVKILKIKISDDGEEYFLQIVDPGTAKFKIGHRFSAFRTDSNTYAGWSFF